jgi:hypothetical protein
MGKRIARLEQALIVWEDTCYLQKRISKFTPESTKILVDMPDHNGPLVHYREFRDHVIHDSVKGNFDIERFTFFRYNQESIVTNCAIPTALFAWNHCSRRVFHLDHNLQTLLSATSMDGVFWNEIKWPFQSFVIELSDPLADSNGKLYDYIIVGEIGKICNVFKNKEGRIVSVVLLPQELENYKPLNKKKIERIFKREIREDMIKLVLKWQRLALDYKESFAFLFSDNPKNSLAVNKPYEESAKYFNEHFRPKGLRKLAEQVGIEMPPIEDEYSSYSLFDKAKHLIASVCLFLETLPPKKTIETNQIEKRKKDEINVGLPCVSIAEEIFQLQSESILSRETQETVAEIIRSRSSRDVRPHWRRGHWRRIWGSKENVSAPRIWIRPCLVNKEKLPPNSVPLASQSNLE